MSQETIARSPVAILVILLTSGALSAWILFENLEDAPRVWGALLLVGVTPLILWTATRFGTQVLHLVDQGVWSILICHTMIVASSRDIRVLADDPSLTPEIALQVAIWVLCLFYALARLGGNVARLRNLLGGAARYATMFLLLALASSYYAISPMITLAWTTKLLTILAVACLLFDPSEPAESARRFLAATYAGLLIMIIVFLFFAALSPESAFYVNGPSSAQRAGGILIPPTQLSGVAGLLSVLALVDLMSGTRRALTKLILVVSVSLMFASLGRGGILAAGVSMSIVLYAFHRLRLAAIVGCSLTLAFLFSPDLVGTSWDVLSRGQDIRDIASLSGRVQLWQKTLELIEMKPLLGWGYVSGSRVALLSSIPWWPAGDTHNAYLEVLLDLGVGGAIILCLLLLRTILASLGSLRSEWDPLAPGEKQLVSLKLLSLIICLLVQGIFEQGFGGAPRFSAVILIGVAFCGDQLTGWPTRSTSGNQVAP